MSGVKGLAAMFEQRGDSKPADDRGRSPGPVRSLGGTPTPESPRPLSKVRTSFVAVEKDGRIGLRREQSGDSVSVSSRRLSNETGTTTPQPISEKSDVFSDNMAKNAAAFKTNLSPEPIPEAPKPKAETINHSSEALEPNRNPDKITDEEEPSAKLRPGLPTDKAAIEGDQHTSNGIGDILKSAPTAPTSKPKATTSKPAPKSAPILTATTKPVTKATKSPTAATAAKSHAKESTKATSSVAEKKTSTATTTAAKKTTASKSTATTAKKPTPVNLPSSTGFVKPKPKSPTRPINLPPSLTTHTAASASKVGSGAAAPAPGRQTSSRASSNAQHLNVHPASHRPSSRASVSTAGAASAGKGLKRQSSNVSRPRPSIGPPPKQPAKDHPVSKREAHHVDEGFLARMMRPTQSSSSKTAEKAPITPPRKHSAPTTTQPRRTTPAHHVEGSAKKAAAKIQASGKPKPATGAAKAAAGETKTTAKEVAPAAAQAETAEEAIEAAKASKETAATPLVEKAEKEVAVEPTSGCVAPVTVQAETVQVSTDASVTPLAEKTEAEDVVEPLADEAGAEDDQPASPIPSITVESEKVEDIEDLVQEPAEAPSDEKTAAAADDDAAEKPAPIGDVKEIAEEAEEKHEEGAKDETMGV